MTAVEAGSGGPRARERLAAQARASSSDSAPRSRRGGERSATLPVRDDTDFSASLRPRGGAGLHPARSVHPSVRRIRACPGEYPYTRGIHPTDVPRPALDDAAVRRLRHRRGHQRALQVPAGAGPDRPLGRLRLPDPDGLRLRSSALRGRGRQVRRGDLSPWPTWRRSSTAFRSTRCLDLDDDQRARRRSSSASTSPPPKSRASPIAKLQGTIQNDILKEYMAQHAWIFPAEPALKMIVDLFEWAAEHTPEVEHDLDLRLPHPRGRLHRRAGAGVHPGQRLLLRRARARAGARRRQLRARGSRSSGTCTTISSRRSPRCARPGGSGPATCASATAPATRAAGRCASTARPPASPSRRSSRYNNIVRVAYQALAAVLGGTQSLHTNALDETLALPTEDSVRIALRTQQILAYETGVPNVADPLGGSYYVEALTDRLEREAEAIFAEIEAQGGVVPAIEAGWFQRQIARSPPSRLQPRSSSASARSSGSTSSSRTTRGRWTSSRVGDEAERVAARAAWPAPRLAGPGRWWTSVSRRSRRAAAEDRNVIPAMLDCARAYCTLFEIRARARDASSEATASRSSSDVPGPSAWRFGWHDRVGRRQHRRAARPAQAVRPGKHRVVTCYLKLEPRDRARGKYLIKVKNRIRELEKVAPALGLDRDGSGEAVRADLRAGPRLAQGTPTRLPATQGLAIFACGPLKLFEVVPLPSVHRSRLAVDRTAAGARAGLGGGRVRPLLTVVLDRTAARFFEVTAFGAEEVDDLRASSTRGGRYHSDRQDAPGKGEQQLPQPDPRGAAAPLAAIAGAALRAATGSGRSTASCSPGRAPTPAPSRPSCTLPRASG